MEIKKSAMWVKKTKNGNDYYSVKIELTSGESVWVNLFWNKFKKEPKHPDYITIDENKQQKQEKEEPSFWEKI